MRAGIINWLQAHNKAAWCVTVCYMGLIFYLSSLPQVSEHIEESTTLLLHMIKYAFLGLLLSIALGLRTKSAFFAMILASVYGVTDEIHQFFVPGRVASIVDIAADSLGAMFGSFSALTLKDKL